MEIKKYLKSPIVVAAFVSVILIFLFCLINFLVDPFGVFGNKPPVNPQTAQIKNLNESFDKYDSYIIGSKQARAFSETDMNEIFSASFCALTLECADMNAYSRLISYLIKKDEVKNILLVIDENEAKLPVYSDSPADKRHYVLSGQSAIGYYLGYLFASPRYWFEKPAITSEALQKQDLESADNCAALLKEIKSICDKKGVSLTVIFPPMHENEISQIGDDTLDNYFKTLSESADFWNFAHTFVSYEKAYFNEDLTITQNTAKMCALRAFENKDSESFGYHCNKDKLYKNAELRVKAKSFTGYKQKVPLLMYHHISPTGPFNEVTVVTPSRFEEDLVFLKENGFTSITFDELIAFNEKGTPLPKKPVIITFDDGYTSNCEYALPILEKHGCKATVFVIGSSMGTDKYKDTNHSIISHFGKNEIDKMCKSGVFSIQSHTYDMHQSKSYENIYNFKVRGDVLPLENESDSEYVKALTDDVRNQHELFSQLGLPKSKVISFPLGKQNELVNDTLKSLGYKCTVTTDEQKENIVVYGLDSSLINLGRLNMSMYTPRERLIEYLN